MGPGFCPVIGCPDIRTLCIAPDKSGISTEKYITKSYALHLTVFYKFKLQNQIDRTLNFREETPFFLSKFPLQSIFILNWCMVLNLNQTALKSAYSKHNDTRVVAILISKSVTEPKVIARAFAVLALSFKSLVLCFYYLLFFIQFLRFYRIFNPNIYFIKVVKLFNYLKYD